MRQARTGSAVALLVVFAMVACNVCQQSASAEDAKGSGIRIAATTAAAAPVDPAADQYRKALEAASAEHAKAIEAVQFESQPKLAAAKTAYDAAVQQARDAYVKALEQELASAGPEAAEATRRKIDFIVNGPPRNEIQKLWSASFAAESNKDFAGAIAAVDKVLQITGNAKNTFTQLRLGWLHYLNGAYDKAEAAYKSAAALAPQALTPLQGLMNCYLALKRPDDAMAMAEAILKRDPMNYRANQTLAEHYYLAKEYARSGAYYQRLATAYPDDMTAATSLGWCYAQLNEKELAARVFSDVLAIEPENASASEGLYAAQSAPSQIARTNEAGTAKAKVAAPLAPGLGGGTAARAAGKPGGRLGK